MRKNKFVVWTVLLLAAVLFVSSCSKKKETTKSEAPSQYEVIANAANDYLSAGKAPVISSSALYANLNDGNTSNDPYVLSIRSATDFANGHIPGAHNIPWRQVAKSENLKKLPKDKQIVVVCYTGHTASQTTMFLNEMGYDAVALKFGMTSWDTVAAHTHIYHSNDPSDCPDYPVEKTPHTLAKGNTFPTVNHTTSTDKEEIIRAATDAYLSSGKAPVILSTALYTNLNDGNPSNDPLVLSVRGHADYLAGHIPGAVNIPYREVARDTNLAKLPTDKQIVVVCYTGHTASQITMLLNQLGYNAVALKYGMTSWTVDPSKNPSVATIKPYDPARDCGNYPVATGSGLLKIAHAVNW